MADQQVIDSLNTVSLANNGTPPDLTKIPYKARNEIREAKQSLYPDDVSDHLVTNLSTIVTEAVRRVQNDI